VFKKYNVSATYKLYFLNTKSIGFEKTYQGLVVTTPPKGSRSNPVKNKNSNKKPIKDLL
jgi:hypothetical protein